MYETQGANAEQPRMISYRQSGVCEGTAIDKQPELHQRLDDVKKSVDYLLKELQVLEGRLQPVLGPEQPANTSARPTPPPATRLTHVVADLNERLRYAVAFVEELRQRLDV